MALMIGAVSVFAQDAQLRSAVAGQKYKIKGVVVAKDDNKHVYCSRHGRRRYESSHRSEHEH